MKRGVHIGNRYSNQGNQGNRGNGRGYHQQPSWSGQFVRIDPDAKFLDGEHVEGVHVLTDFDLAREIQVRLGKFSNGPTDFFPAMWPVTLSSKNIEFLATKPYVLAPKPKGPRFLLYVDACGQIFLENMTQNIFRVDEDHAVKMASFGGRPITDTILDGILTREKLNSSDCCAESDLEADGKLTFVIQDAIRCNGENLTSLNILQRIAFVEEEIMKPRRDLSNNREVSNEDEAFSLDIVEIKDAHQAEEYLSKEFDYRFKYKLRSVVFYPKRKGYVCGTCQDVFQWAENDILECSFRLLIPRGSKEAKEAELHVVGPYRKEIKFDTIMLTEELHQLDREIIDCRYVDHHWIYMKVRKDRKHPNGRRSVLDKVDVLDHQVTRNHLLTTLDKSRGID